MLEVIVIGGLLAWTMMSYQEKNLAIADKGSVVTATERFKSLVDNGYQFRDVTFSTMADYLGHPDMKNNFFAQQRAGVAIQDDGVFGTARNTVQLYPGVSEAMQISRRGNLAL